jgi:hypothetical protein
LTPVTFASATAAIVAGDLPAAVAQVEAYRQLPDQPINHRGVLAADLALAFLAVDDLNEAERWALRAQQGTCDPSVMCLLGEIAWRRSAFETACGWYQAAVGAANIRPFVSRRVLLPVLMQNADVRLHQMQDVYPVRPWKSNLDRGRHMLMILTAPRTQSGALLERTLTSLRDAGLDRWPVKDFAIVADGYDPAVASGYEILRLPGAPRGHVRALLAAFEFALAARPQVLRLTILEDDIVLVKNALDYIRVSQPCDGWFLHSWYSGVAAPFPSMPPPYDVVLPSSVFTRTQAVTYPRYTMEEVVNSSIARFWTEPHGGDVMLAKIGGACSCGIHFPSLVQHTGGAASLVGSVQQFSTSPTFPGEDFDALRLVFDAKK